MKALPSPEMMYRALVRRDSAFDGVFVVAVKTTRIFCRPICPARNPKRQNIEFFASPSEARGAGYRPCKRCRPADLPGTHPAWVTELLERLAGQNGRRLTDADLLASGVQPSRARRYWRTHFGMTVHAYQRAQRLGVAMDRINDGNGLLRAGYEAGYESDSGFREAFRTVFGAPPGKARGDQAYANATMIPTPLGPMIAAATGEHLWFLEFLDRRGIVSQGQTLLQRLGRPVIPGTNLVLRETARQLGEYFGRTRTEFELPIAVVGTPFQEQVWRELLVIGYGETRSYEAIAKAVGTGKGSRAVGRANGMNRIGIVIPCHRVIRKDGTLSGYGGGLWRKKRLLELESGS